MWTVVAEVFAFIIICYEKKKHYSNYFLLSTGDEKGLFLVLEAITTLNKHVTLKHAFCDEKLFSLQFRAIIWLIGLTAVINASNLFSHLMDSIEDSLINPRF